MQPERLRTRAHLDAAQGPLHPVARDTLLAALDAGWADPRRLHREGRRAAILLDQAREILAGGLGVRPDEVSLHASGAHALRAGIQGLRSARRRVGAHLVTSAIDQAVVVREVQGGSPVGVSGLGHVDGEQWARALNAPDVALAVLADANGEIGTRQDLGPLAESAAAAGVPLLVDVATAWGRLPLPAVGNGYAADTASFAGPPLGVLAIRTGTRFGRVGPPSGPEQGREVAPPFVPLALAAAEAWRQVEDDRERDAESARTLVAQIRSAAAAVADVQVVGDPDARAPHVVTFSALYVDGEALVHEFDRRGFAVASGSACTADTLEPSHVLAAIGAVTHGNVRVTVPLQAVAPNRAADVARFCAELPDVIASVRAQLGTEDL